MLSSSFQKCISTEQKSSGEKPCLGQKAVFANSQESVFMAMSKPQGWPQDQGQSWVLPGSWCPTPAPGRGLCHSLL